MQKETASVKGDTERNTTVENVNNSETHTAERSAEENSPLQLNMPVKKEMEPINETEIQKPPLKDIKKSKEDALKNLQDTMLLISRSPIRHFDQKDAPFTVEFRQSILKLAKSYFHYKVGEVPYSVISGYRSEVGKALTTNGVVWVMCDALSDGLKRKDFMDEHRNMLKEYWFPIKNILLTLLNFSDSDNSVRISVTEHPDALSLVLKYLQDWQKEHLHLDLSDDQNKLVKWSLSILHNCASSDDNVPKLRELGVIQAVLPYLDSATDNVRLSSISILALLVNEQESKLLRAHISIFQFMISKLGKALKKEDRKDLGWSAAELTTALGKLARNDTNKRILVEEGCLPVLVEELRTGDEGEVKEAINCLWALSFDGGNKRKMVDEPDLVKVVYEKYLVSVGSLRHNYHGVLWSLREEMLASNEFRTIGEEMSNLSDLKSSTTLDLTLPTPAPPPPPPPASAPASAPPPPGFGQVPDAPSVQGHVMISYQWAHQEVIKQICQTLRQHHIPVWIDIDYMGGSTLQAMAKAVEDSFVVIVAMSQKYKDSPNTRAEAEYTFQRRKRIIPLIMQRDYRPDGWLGLILGTKLFYDFSGKYKFESRMEALLEAVKTLMKGGGMESGDTLEPKLQSTTVSLTEAKAQVSVHKAATVTSQIHHQEMSESNALSVRSWTQADITKWLEKYHLENSTLMSLDAEEIIFLHNLRSEAPEFFYHCLESKLSVTSLQDLSKAARALSDLTL